MGMPAFKIPDTVVPSLQEILASTGANIIDEPISPDAIKLGYVRVLMCTLDDGVAVRATVQRVRKGGSEKLVLLLLPASQSWWRILAEQRLMKQLDSALRKNGATET